MSTPTTAPGQQAVELRRIAPGELWDEWLTRKGAKKRQNTIDETERAWDAFCEWADTENVTHLSDLGPFFAADFRKHLEATTDQNDLSLYYLITRVKVVAEYGKGQGYLHQDYPYSWDRPELSSDEKQRDEYLLPERGHDISKWVRLEYPYQNEHVLWKLAFDYGLRKSAIRAIDLEHVVLDPDERNPPHIKLRDRPDLGPDGDKGLPLKNTWPELSKRSVPLQPDMVDVLRQYIDRQRRDPDGTDKYGLEGLVTTQRSARMSENGIYRTICKLTSPATYEGSCDCDACREYRDKNGKPLPAQDRYKCGWSRPPHGVRHGSITDMINQGKDLDTVSYIVGTLPSTLRRVYDRRTEEERMNAIADD